MDYTLPTPQQVNYGVDPNLQKVLNEIENCLKRTNPVFTLDQNPLLYQFVKDDVNNIIGQFGWMIKSKWIGACDKQGTTHWEICPL